MSTNSDGLPAAVKKTDEEGDNTYYSFEYCPDNTLKTINHIVYYDGNTGVMYRYTASYNEDGTMRKRKTVFPAILLSSDDSIYTDTYSYSEYVDGKPTKCTAVDEEGEVTNYSFEYDEHGNVIREYENSKLTYEYEYQEIKHPSA